MPPAVQPCFSGAVVRQHVELLTERYGEEVIEEVLSDLPVDQAAQLANLLPMDWVPVTVFEAFYDRVASRVGCPLEELHWEFGQLAVERAFKTIWRVMLRFTSDEALVSRTPIFYSKTYNAGSLTSTIPSPGRGELQLEGWPESSVPTFVRRGLCIGVSTVLRLAGRADVRVVAEPRRGGAVLVATWST